jgi:hypothetical protein
MVLLSARFFWARAARRRDKRWKRPPASPNPASPRADGGAGRPGAPSLRAGAGDHLHNLPTDAPRLDRVRPSTSHMQGMTRSGSRASNGRLRMLGTATTRLPGVFIARHLAPRPPPRAAVASVNRLRPTAPSWRRLTAPPGPPRHRVAASPRHQAHPAIAAPRHRATAPPPNSRRPHHRPCPAQEFCDTLNCGP